VNVIKSTDTTNGGNNSSSGNASNSSDANDSRDAGADTVATAGAPATATEGQQQHKRQLEHQGTPAAMTLETLENSRSRRDSGNSRRKSERAN
jgi:hypothetical protein